MRWGRSLIRITSVSGSLSGRTELSPGQKGSELMFGKHLRFHLNIASAGELSSIQKLVLEVLARLCLDKQNVLLYE